MSLLSRLLYLRVRLEYSPKDIESLGLDRQRPLVYVLSTDSMTARAIVQHEISHGRLPPAPSGSNEGATAVLATRRLVGFWNRRHEYDAFIDRLAELIRQVQEQPDAVIQLVPTSVFLGRAPKKEPGLLKLLFAEKWRITGRIRRFFSILINGKHSLLRLGKPMVLDADLVAGEDARKLARKFSRVLRVHARRVKTSVVGPDLSHRRTIARNILKRPAVAEEIEAYARRKKISPEKAHKEANKIIREIAADYSYSSIKLMYRIFGWFWNKVYDGIQLNFFEQFRSMSTGHEIIYTPCHRSHIDYLIMSFALYERGLVPPHIAAGINLNLPIVGRLLRGSGAFFLRRSFNSVLYSTIFSEYLSSLISHGVSIEYFVEGTRSRTGRLLHPKAGILAMTIRSYINERSQPLIFQPASLNYEKLMEGASYQSELGGQGKQKESIGGLFKTLKLLKQRFGRLTVNFSEAVPLDEILDRHRPDWRNVHLGVKEKPAWFKDAVTEAGHTIMTRINASAHVNPINLIAITLLSTPNQSAVESNLCEQIELYKTLLTELPYSERTTVSELSAQAIIERAIELGFVERVAHPLGDVVRVRANMAVMLAYYRNNILHLFAAASFIAMCFVNQAKHPRKALLRLMAILHPFVKNELFLKWSREEFVERGRETLKLMKQLGLLQSSGRMLERHPGGTLSAGKMRVLGNALLQTYERYFIVIAVLKHHPSASLTAADLESICHQTASQLSLLYDYVSPDFFDKSLFKQFIRSMREEGLIQLNDEAKIVHSGTLDTLFEGAHLILSKRIRHSILTLMQNSQAPTQQAS